MKIALLVRGFHNLAQDRFGYALDARRMLPSLLEQLIEPLRREHRLRIFVVTYPSPIEDELRDRLGAACWLSLDPRSSSQLATFRRGLQAIADDPDGPFDRVIATRFDLEYLRPVSDWNIWDRTGVFFPWREYEEYWHAHHRVGDACHIVDRPCLAAFDEAIGRLQGQTDMHLLYDALAELGVPSHFIVPGFYDSNTLFGNPECDNPIYRIGNRPKLRRPSSRSAAWLKPVKRAIPERLWKLLTHPRMKPPASRRAG